MGLIFTKVSRNSQSYDADLFTQTKRLNKHFPTPHKNIHGKLKPSIFPFYKGPIFLIDERYFRSTVARGSVPELPAETCKEIKASEEGQAVSGEYWFYSIVPGKTVLAPCDMETEGESYLLLRQKPFLKKKMFHFMSSALQRMSFYI